MYMKLEEYRHSRRLSFLDSSLLLAFCSNYVRAEMGFVQGLGIQMIPVLSIVKQQR
jgi:hypothetical protein